MSVLESRHFCFDAVCDVQVLQKLFSDEGAMGAATATATATSTPTSTRTATPETTPTATLRDVDTGCFPIDPCPHRPAGGAMMAGSIASGGGHAYDANGNLIAYKGWSFTYDAQNRLTGASNGAISAEFYYDGKNRQIARKIGPQSGGGGVIRFSAWDNWELLEESAGGTQWTTSYLQGATGVIKSWGGNGTFYYYQDKLGSTTHIANASGALLESYRYDLYGTPSYLNSTSQPLNSSTYGIADLYAGERWIPELRVYDLRNRFMSPELGRFLQSDPIGFKGDASNLYRYCGNDPVDRADPTGLVDTTAGSNLGGT